MWKTNKLANERTLDFSTMYSPGSIPYSNFFDMVELPNNFIFRTIFDHTSTDQHGHGKGHGEVGLNSIFSITVANSTVPHSVAVKVLLCQNPEGSYSRRRLWSNLLRLFSAILPMDLSHTCAFPRIPSLN